MSTSAIGAFLGVRRLRRGLHVPALAPAASRAADTPTRT